MANIEIIVVSDRGFTMNYMKETPDETIKCLEVHHIILINSLSHSFRLLDIPP